MGNIDFSTLQAFEDKWGTRWKGYTDRAHDERIFDIFFSLFPFEELRNGEGFDLGCGVGRHAAMIAPRVGRLHCIDPSPNAIAQTRKILAGQSNVECHLAGVDDMPMDEGSQDFGFSMGVLHHVPDTQKALRRCVGKLKPGAPFLLYLYYRFDNRPLWFRAIWIVSNWGRFLICPLPRRAKKVICDCIAVLIYWPLSRLAFLLERWGRNVEHFPLSFYRHSPLVNLKVSSFDRFTTPLERRFTRSEIERLMRMSGLERIQFQDRAPYWVALGYRKRSSIQSSQ